jgi:hypothetical protein
MMRNTPEPTSRREASANAVARDPVGGSEFERTVTGIASVEAAAVVTTVVGSTLAGGVVVASVDGGAVTTVVVGAGGVVGTVTTVVATVVGGGGTVVVVVGVAQAGTSDRGQEGPALLRWADPTTNTNARPTTQATFVPIDERAVGFVLAVEIMG